MRIVAIEEHWADAAIEQALAAQPDGERDPSLAFNTMGDHGSRLADMGAGRLAGMDALGIDVSVLGLAPPGTQPLPGPEAVALSRDANDASAAAVAAHPSRLAALATLPTADPDAATVELDRCVGLGHVGLMLYGRTGDQPLDHPRFDDLLGQAARHRLPVFLHPQIPSPAVRAASYGGFDADVSLGLATFGWGWHIDAGLAALRLMLAGTFDRHPDLQLILGHWGEVLLFWLDRADSLSNVATHLDRRISDYVRENVHITCSGMLEPRLLRHALEYTTIDRVVFSTDHPFPRVDAAAVERFFASIADPHDRELVGSGNAERLFRLPPHDDRPDQR